MANSLQIFQSPNIQESLSEIWESVERAVGESDLIRSERKNQPLSLVENFEAGP